MTQGGVSALMQALQSSAPPRNPGTPDSRLDPRVEYLQALASARKSLERLVDNAEDPVLKQAFGAMHYAANKAMAGIDPPTILQTLVTALQSAMPPGGAVQPGGPPMPAPGLPQASPPTAPPGPQGPNPGMLAALAGGGSPGTEPPGPTPVPQALGA
jgi:hypothetical protein